MVRLKLGGFPEAENPSTLARQPWEQPAASCSSPELGNRAEIAEIMQIFQLNATTHPTWRGILLLRMLSGECWSSLCFLLPPAEGNVWDNTLQICLEKHGIIHSV